MPSALRDRLLTLKAKKTVVVGGGKQYWTKSATALGIVETEHGLEFAKKESKAASAVRSTSA